MQINSKNTYRKYNIIKKMQININIAIQIVS